MKQRNTLDFCLHENIVLEEKQIFRTNLSTVLIKYCCNLILIATLDNAKTSRDAKKQGKLFFFLRICFYNFFPQCHMSPVL